MRWSRIQVTQEHEYATNLLEIGKWLLYRRRNTKKRNIPKEGEIKKMSKVGSKLKNRENHTQGVHINSNKASRLCYKAKPRRTWRLEALTVVQQCIPVCRSKQFENPTRSRRCFQENSKWPNHQFFGDIFGLRVRKIYQVLRIRYQVPDIFCKSSRNRRSRSRWKLV